MSARASLAGGDSTGRRGHATRTPSASFGGMKNAPEESVGRILQPNLTRWWGVEGPDLSG